MTVKFRQGSKPALFIELANPDINGCSRKVLVTEFIDKYEKLKFGNGGSWCRKESTLAKFFIIELFKEEKGNAISAVQLFGHNTKNKINKYISASIRGEINSKKCAALYISNVETDHKDGRRDDFENFKIENQLIDQFQPLSSSANKAKRQHCKVCRDTGLRFDATVLGFSQPCWTGNGQYRGSCVGCYWYDIKKFNQEISKGFKSSVKLMYKFPKK